MQQLWRHLAALFGADALERKFGRSAPPEWEGAVAELSTAQLAQGIAWLPKSGRRDVPSLPEFLAACRGAREFSTPVRRLEDGRFDGWDVTANSHLLAYLRERQQHRRYSPTGQPDAATRERTMCLVRAKHRWAKCMRETNSGSGVDVETQQAVWRVEMARAEREIDAINARRAAA